MKLGRVTRNSLVALAALAPGYLLADEACYVRNASCTGGAGGAFCADGVTICDEGYVGQITMNQPGVWGPLGNPLEPRYCTYYPSGTVVSGCASVPEEDSPYYYTGCSKTTPTGPICCYATGDGATRTQVGSQTHPTGGACP